MTDIEKCSHQTPGVTHQQCFEFNNFVTINNLTRQYLLMMMQMQESPLLRDMFSCITFDEEIAGMCQKSIQDKTINPQKIIQVNSTSLTTHFLGEGLIIYQFCSINSALPPASTQDKHLKKDEVVEFPLEDQGFYGLPVNPSCQYRKALWARLNDKFGVIKPSDRSADDSQFEIDVNKTYTNSKGEEFRVSIIARHSGCGFKSPENALIRLDPRLVWCQTKLKLKHRPATNDEAAIDNKNDGLYIVNFAGGAQWYRDSWPKIDELDNTAFMAPNWGKGKSFVISTSTQELSESKVSFDILENKSGTIDKVIIIMPFVCCAFDMLTEVYFDDNDEPLVLFST
ncbi:MAG: hypothetical protein HRT35_12530 [Algicola sp.]|nr:hypothetical protein [Algicola sp.]